MSRSSLSSRDTARTWAHGKRRKGESIARRTLREQDIKGRFASCLSAIDLRGHPCLPVIAGRDIKRRCKVHSQPSLLTIPIRTYRRWWSHSARKSRGHYDGPCSIAGSCNDTREATVTVDDPVLTPVIQFPRRNPERPCLHLIERWEISCGREFSTIVSILSFYYLSSFYNVIITLKTRVLASRVNSDLQLCLRFLTL
jgi:hypothetical protein